MPENFRYGEGFKPLQVYELVDGDIGEPDPAVLDKLLVEFEQRLQVAAASAADIFDKTVHDAIVREAQRAGITSLVIFDRDFVVAAIREKMEREGYM